MKILLISNLYEPYARGGAEVIVKRTAEGLIQSGHEVVLLTARPFAGVSSFFPHTEKKDGLRLMSYYPLNLFFYANDYHWPMVIRFVWHFFDLFNLHSAWVVRKVIKQISPDLIITHNLIGLGYAVMPVIKASGHKHIHVLHDIQLAVRSGLMRKGQESAWFVSGVVARGYQAIVRRLLGSPQKVISPSAFLLEFYRRLGYFPHSTLQVLQNPIDERFFQTRVQSGSSDKVVFAYVGQLAEHKGISTLLKAFEEINGCVLNIAGDGPLRTKVEEIASQSSSIQYLGKIPNEELPRFYEASDAVIVPTETYENAPTVVFEALASARPVIVCDIGGAAEAVKDGVNGFVIPPGDLELLRKKIEAMKQAHHQMREAARASVQGMDRQTYLRKLLAD